MALLVTFLLMTHEGAAADAAPNTVAHGPIPISNFIRQPDFSRVTISPDGRYLAALVPLPDNPTAT